MNREMIINFMKRVVPYKAEDIQTPLEKKFSDLFEVLIYEMSPDRSLRDGYAVFCRVDELIYNITGFSTFDATMFENCEESISEFAKEIVEQGVYNKGQDWYVCKPVFERTEEGGYWRFEIDDYCRFKNKELFDYWENFLSFYKG